MTLPASGAISFNAINVELAVAGATNASLNQASYRALAGVPSGTISLSNFYSKTYRVVSSIVISANTANYVLNTAKVSGYVAGKTDVTLTINSGIYVYSASTGSYALQVDTSWAAGDTVTIVNNGIILGRGGDGGAGGTGYSQAPAGGAGGPGLIVQRATTFANYGTISGGGGGGGGGGLANSLVGGYPNANGGSGGGGRGNGSPNGSLTGPGAGAAGGGYCVSYKVYTVCWYGGTGGAGGGFASAGAAGVTQSWAGGAGGAGGACLAGNGNITWTAVGLRYGTIS